MEELYQLNQKRANKMALLDKLIELSKYTKKHFHDEEQHMDSIKYADRERHKIIHQQLLTELSNHIERFQTQHQLLSDEFFYFLKHWLTAHIKHIDTKYGAVSKDIQQAS